MFSEKMDLNFNLLNIVDVMGFRLHYMDLILANSTVSAENSCIMWNKCVNDSYGKMSYTVYLANDDGSVRSVKKWASPHRLMFAVVYDCLHLLDSPHYKTREISHICHHGKCVNPEHLEIETHAQNGDRDKCKHKISCQDHDPPCILPV